MTKPIQFMEEDDDEPVPTPAPKPADLSPAELFEQYTRTTATPFPSSEILKLLKEKGYF